MAQGRQSAGAPDSAGGQFRAHEHSLPVPLAQEAVVPIPHPTLEERTWVSRDPDLSHTARRKGTGKYFVSQPPEIADIALGLPAGLVQESEEALLILKDFEASTRSALGSNSAPLSAILLRTESSSSSQIENLTVGAKQLALAELGDAKSTNARLVSANVRAMEQAVKLSEDISIENVLAMHAALMQADPHMRTQAGQFRQEIVWVGSSNSRSPVGAKHVAPDYRSVPRLVGDCVAFLRRDDLPVIPQIAIGHAQFETIHPFTDGNGRTGRAIIQSFLKNKGVSGSVTIPLSAGLLSNRQLYFEALDEFRRGDAAPIIQVFSNSAISAAHKGQSLVEELVRIRDSNRAKLVGYRRDAMVHKIPELLISQPVVDSAYVARAFNVSLPNAIRILRQAAESGLVTQTGDALRNRTWQNSDILHALDTFAEQIRR